MKGDFSRISFDPRNHFSRVLVQQGRVTLDADPNEQSAILLHYLRALARDLIGPYGGPADNLGFVLGVDDSTKPATLGISAGHYYVDGILCECEGCGYADQPDYAPAPPDANGQNGDPLLGWLQSKTPGEETFWAYLDVWERHISSIEDARIREVALGGPDTCSRAKIVWQVKAMTVDTILGLLQERKKTTDDRLRLSKLGSQSSDSQALAQRSQRLAKEISTLQKNPQDPGSCAAGLDALAQVGEAKLAARLDPGQQIKDPCTISPDAQYRGAENQLYRIEIHRGGEAGAAASFKWSRDNGSVATRWLSTDGNDLVVGSTRGFEAGCWIELSDDGDDLLGRPGLLVKLAKVEGDRLSVDPNSIPQGSSVALEQGAGNPKVRRWDQTENDDITLRNGAVPVVETTDDTRPNWIDLEDGIQVRFAAGGRYRCGDYWLIPARVATGSIEWPQGAAADGSTTWLLEPPRGIRHHYAPLGFLSWTAPNQNGGGFAVSRCNCRLLPTNSCAQAVRGQQPTMTVQPVGNLVAERAATAPATPAKRARTRKKTK